MRKGLVLKLAVAATCGLMALKANAEKDVTYVGGGRYVCQGSDCKKFDREQSRLNYLQEERERYRREERREARETIDAIKQDSRREKW